MKDCIFCKIANHEAEAKIEYEDERFLVFWDTHPRAPVHLLVVPRKHVNIDHLVEEEDMEIMRGLFKIGAKMVKKFDLQEGFVFRINGGNYKHIDHLHLWVLGGSEKEPLTENAPDFE